MDGGTDGHDIANYAASDVGIELSFNSMDNLIEVIEGAKCLYRYFNWF